MGSERSTQTDTDTDNEGYPAEGIAGKSLWNKDLCLKNGSGVFRNSLLSKDLCRSFSRRRMCRLVRRAMGPRQAACEMVCLICM